LAEVFFASGLQQHTGGAARATVEARDVRELIDALDRRFPGLGRHLRSGMAVAIDGEIIQQPLLERLDPASEVHFLPPIGGGRG
jgi:sulfur-carrier protein